MRATDQQVIWQKLVDAGIARGEMPQRAERSTPWFVRVMLGVAGWIGALFLLGFIGATMAFVFRSESAAIFVGGGCCAAAFAIFRVGGRNDLIAQFGLASSLVGQALIGFGLYESTNGGTSFYLGLIIVEAVLALTLNNFVNRVCSTFIAAFTLSYLLRDMGLPGAAPGAIAIASAVLWLGESKWAATGSMWRAIGYGLAFALVIPDFSALWTGYVPRGLSTSVVMWTIWLKPLLVGAALVYTVHRLLTQEHADIGTATWNAAMAATAGIALVTLRASGITSSLLLVLLGFARGNRALFGIGVAAMLWYLGTFYYSMQMSLLWKSFALALSGVTLLALWGITRQLFGATDDAPARESANA